MAQYINKAALVAEIENYISNYKEIVAKTNRNDSTWVDSVSMIDAKIGVLQHLLSFLDTLEVKGSLQTELVSEVWHKISEVPNFVSDNTYTNSILVCGETSLGIGASVCYMIDQDTIYAPIASKEYKWGECPFTMWAYVRDLLHKKAEPVSEDLEKEIHNQAMKLHTAPTYEELRNFALHFVEWQKEQMLRDAIGGEVQEPESLWWRIVSDDLEGGFILRKALHDGDRVKLIIVKED
jgi:hypothetical protein